MCACKIPLVAFVNGFNLNAKLAQIKDICGPPWRWACDGRATLPICFDKMVHCPSVAAFQRQAKRLASIVRGYCINELIYHPNLS